MCLNHVNYSVSINIYVKSLQQVLLLDSKNSQSGKGPHAIGEI
jgi:hypothetical protein